MKKEVVQIEDVATVEPPLLNHLEFDPVCPRGQLKGNHLYPVQGRGVTGAYRNILLVIDADLPIVQDEPKGGGVGGEKVVFGARQGSPVPEIEGAPSST